jgi:Flp pilus assembly protein TadD
MNEKWLKRFSILLEMRYWPEMLAWCFKWTKCEPENAEAWFRLGWIYDELNRYEDAIGAYRQALRINPEHADAWSNLGVTYSNIKSRDDAVEAFRQALRINPEHPIARRRIISFACGPCGIPPDKRPSYFIPDSICKSCPYAECKKEREIETARYTAPILNALLALGGKERWLSQEMC